MQPCCLFYKFITDVGWGIVIMDVLVRINGARSEETKESATVNLASWALSHASQIWNDES